MGSTYQITMVIFTRYPSKLSGYQMSVVHLLVWKQTVFIKATKDTEMKKFEPSQLTQFIGTEKYYRISRRHLLTDGTKYLAEEAECVEWHSKLSHFEENLHPNLSHPKRLSCLIFKQGWARSDQRGNFEQIMQTCPSRQGLRPWVSPLNDSPIGIP